ncbi:MAG TPA: HAD family phosphatase [Ohtaekwangia sp.]
MAVAKAFLFDLNGTMIDDMEFHLKVWHDVLNYELHAGLSLQEVKNNMYGTGEELLARVFGKDKFTAIEASAILRAKEEKYQKVYKPHLDLLPGLFDFLEKAHQKGIPMAIGSAAPLFNIDFALDNLNIRHYFGAVVSGQDVAESKPHPEVFLKAAELINASPESCIVFEDAPKGVEAALNAGMKSIVITGMHTEEEFSRYPNVLRFVPDYLSIQDLVQ